MSVFYGRKRDMSEWRIFHGALPRTFFWNREARLISHRIGFSVFEGPARDRRVAHVLVLVLVVIFAMVNSSFECAAVPCIVAADVNDSFVLRIRPWTWLKVSEQLRGRRT